MEVSSSAADITHSLESIPVGNPFSKAYLLTESAFVEPEPLLEFEYLPAEELIAQPLAPSETNEPAAIAKDSGDSQWKAFGSTFITIFLAELGDKTQVATLLMSAESHAPWVVFTGAAAALVTTSLLGVLVGQWLSSRISLKTLDTAAGITLALLSLWLLLDVVKM